MIDTRSAGNQTNDLPRTSNDQSGATLSKYSNFPQRRVRIGCCGTGLVLTRMEVGDQRRAADAYGVTLPALLRRRIRCADAADFDFAQGGAG